MAITLSAVTVLDALFWVVSLVLVVAGASKLTDPAPVAATLSALRRPSGSTAHPAGPGSGVGLARSVGALEVVVGLAALTVGGPLVALAVAAAYAAFAVVVVVARSRGLESCGCFGVASAPPSWVHVAVNVVSAAVAVAAAVAGPVPASDGLSALGGPDAVVVGCLVLLATALVVVIDTTVADVVEAARLVRSQADDDPTPSPERPSEVLTP